MIRVTRTNPDTDAMPPPQRRDGPTSVSAYDLAREIALQIEEAEGDLLTIGLGEDDEVRFAEFNNDGVALIERIIAAALRNGGVRP